MMGSLRSAVVKAATTMVQGLGPQQHRSVHMAIQMNMPMSMHVSIHISMDMCTDMCI